MRLTATAALIAMTLASPALGQSSNLCSAMGQYSETVMKVRQGGHPKSALLDSMRRNGGITPIGREIADMAYEQPIERTRSGKVRATVLFSDEVKRQCKESLGIFK